MNELLRTPEGKKVRVSMSNDINLYEAPKNPPNTGTAFTSGSDLYAHKARSGKWYFYLHKWSMWQGTDNTLTLISEDEAQERILEWATCGNDRISSSVDMEECEKLWGESFFEEDA
jgi:hypothetical protein